MEIRSRSNMEIRSKVKNIGYSRDIFIIKKYSREEPYFAPLNEKDVPQNTNLLRSLILCFMERPLS